MDNGIIIDCHYISEIVVCKDANNNNSDMISIQLVLKSWDISRAKSFDKLDQELSKIESSSSLLLQNQILLITFDDNFYFRSIRS